MNRLLVTLISLTGIVTLYAETLVYFGTYTSGESEGIYRSSLNTETGELSEPILAAKVTSPSFLAIQPSGKHLFAVSELAKAEAVVTSFRIDSEGDLTKVNARETKGDHPCHLTVDSTGQIVLVANYSGGSCASYSVAQDGTLSDASFQQHAGRSVDPRRQKGPHAHSINLDPQNKRAFCADLGLDKILIYNFDAATGKLTANDPASFQSAPGSGPRHFSFHPSGKFAYACLEMTREIFAMTYDEATGALGAIQTLSTIPADAPAKGSTAECLVHPSGKWVYVSNRGHDSIAVFAIDQTSGKLTFIEAESTQGKTPRGFGIDPSGTFLIAGNQNSGNVSLLRIDEGSGALEPTGNGLKIDKAVSVKFLQKE